MSRLLKMNKRTRSLCPNRGSISTGKTWEGVISSRIGKMVIDSFFTNIWVYKKWIKVLIYPKRTKKKTVEIHIKFMHFLYETVILVKIYIKLKYLSLSSAGIKDL
jgi:hypothetical protein